MEKKETTPMTKAERNEIVKSFVKGDCVEWQGRPDVAKLGTRMLVEAPKIVDGVPFVRVRWADRRDVVVSPVNIQGVKVSAADLTKMREALGLRMPGEKKAKPAKKVKAAKKSKKAKKPKATKAVVEVAEAK